ncbi:hypothetical protein [Leclercia tamurae]|uniref:GIY-YIG nuclease family protein n=1 Tax=Leclercia tamurae TaxID=2926467 RepID=A0ABT2RGS3_9ENTR|nr:hypothetical protein [Leclercia tamurae]MCU6679998.1 hypothetical protein [Leclercia tamurae]
MTKRIANRLSVEQAEIKIVSVLVSKGHTMRPVMSTYIDYNSPVLIQCPICQDSRSPKVTQICMRGAECKCYKDKKKQAMIVARNERERLRKEERENAKPKPLTYRERWDRNNYTERLKKKTPNLIPDIETFTDSKIPMKMFCTECNQTVDKRVHDALRGMNCKYCYGVGFTKERMANLYILKLYLDSDKQVSLGYKLGITNKEPQERCDYINKSTDLFCEVIYSIESNGEHIAKVERQILNAIPTGFCSKDVMGDGYTETFNGTYLNEVIRLLFELT